MFRAAQDFWCTVWMSPHSGLRNGSLVQQTWAGNPLLLVTPSPRSLARQVQTKWRDNPKSVILTSKNEGHSAFGLGRSGSLKRP